MTKKNTFYFSHDYNTRTDEKIKNLLRTHGLLGYGVYWALIEDLYNNANAMQLHYSGISYDLRISPELAQSVINDFGLFSIDGDYFSSPSVERRLQEVEKRSEIARTKAVNRWNKYNSNATAMPQHSNVNALNKRKEIKESIKDIPTLFISTLGRNPKASEVEETEPLIEKFGMDKIYLAYKKAGLHNFKNLPNIIKHIDKDGVFVLESEMKLNDDRFDKPIKRLN